MTETAKPTDTPSLGDMVQVPRETLERIVTDLQQIRQELDGLKQELRK